MREIFEDAEENYYAETPDELAPMIFFDGDGFWSGEGKPEGIKLDEAIRSLFTWRFGDLSKSPFPVKERIVFETDHRKILGVLDSYSRATSGRFQASLKRGGHLPR